MKICYVCLQQKDICLFKQRTKINTKGETYLYIETICKTCHATRNNAYNKLNTFKTKSNRKKYYLNNKSKELYNNKIYYRNRRQSDPAFKLRKDISARIATYLKEIGKCKNTSLINYLPYTIEELKYHLESQFEWWMNWNNHGMYNSTWDDNNPDTWTWQIDHIIPHSMLAYASLEDENFKICWSLNNLRPLNAKQNVLDGSSKIRHVK
jgi:hypothetical protein